MTRAAKRTGLTQVMAALPIGRLALAGLGAVTTRRALAAVSGKPGAARLMRTNYRGAPVSLAGGLALASGASLAAASGALLAGRRAAGQPGPGTVALAALVAGVGTATVGRYDDVAGARPEQRSAKGFRGHLAALARGRVTSGLVKIVGVGAVGLAAAALIQPPLADGNHGRRGWRHRKGPVRTANLLLGAGVIAGSANLINLLDLRPGRALKAGLLLGAPLAAGSDGALVAGPLGAAAALLAADLGEQIMLGDCGANALGALLGVAAAARTGPGGRALLLGAIGALTAASERVSFTEVIATTPVLRQLDALGRRPG